MFTGIIQQLGTVNFLRPEAKGALLCVDAPGLTQASELLLGESIAVDGACLTLSQQQGPQLFFQLSEETLARTCARYYVPGDRVHLEQALRFSDRMGGHMVLGHVDDTLVIQAIHQKPDSTLMQVGPVISLARVFLLEKGSVTISGVSLTLNTVTEDYFSLCLIPHTLLHTTLAEKKVGAYVNVEYDYVAKCVANAVRFMGDAHVASIV